MANSSSFSIPPTISTPYHIPPCKATLLDIIQVLFANSYFQHWKWFLSSTPQSPSNDHPCQSWNFPRRNNCSWFIKLLNPLPSHKLPKISVHWVLTMENEYTTLLKNNTWQLVPSPTHANIIGCKWVYKLKCKPNGSIDRYKACLAAQGFTHTSRLDYFDTFSLEVKVWTIRIVLAISLFYQWPLR